MRSSFSAARKPCELLRPLHMVAQHQHEHDLGQPVEHALPAGGAGVVFREHQARERVQLGGGALVFAAHHDRRRQCLHDGVQPAGLELHHGAQHRGVRSVAGRGEMHARLALRRAGELVPRGVREHHQIAAAHDHGLGLAFAVQPGLAASYQVKGGARNAGRIERPGAAVTPLLENPGPQPKAMQHVR
jgi:hypothetical protein